MQNKVEICGVNTSKLKVLKNDETQALLLRAKQGDMKAREELIAGNLRLVLSVIQRFANRGRTRTTCSRWGASASSRPSTTSTRIWTCASPPMACP